MDAYDASDTENDNIAIGHNANATGNARAIAIGKDTTASGNSSVALGSTSTMSTGQHSIAIGTSSQATGNYAISIGRDARALVNTGIAIGSHTEVVSGHTNSIVLGNGVQNTTGNRLLSTATNQFVVGFGSVNPTILIGATTDSYIKTTGELSLESNGLLIPRLTTAQMNAISTPSTDLLVFNTDLDCVMRYNGTAWTTFDSPKYILKSGGNNTPYSSFYTAVNDAVDDDVIEVNVSETVDCGLGNGSWNWSSNISINLKGHKIGLTNLSRVSLADNIDLSITGGGVFTMTHGNQSIFNSNGNATFTSDGSVIMYSKGGVFKQLSNDATKTFIINNVRQTIKDNNRYFIYNSTTDGKIVANNCYGEMDNATNSDATLFYGKNIVINNGIFIGRIYFSGGGNVLSEQSTIFNNCSIDSDGQGVFGDIAVKINNCDIKCNNAQILSNGNIIAKKDSSFYAKPRGYSNFYNCTIESSTSGIYFLIFGGTTNSNIENCKITALNGTGIVKYSTPLLVLVVVKNSIIESTGGNCIVATQSNKGLLIDLSDSTLICNTSGLFCIGASSGTFARFDNLKMKNTAK